MRKVVMSNAAVAFAASSEIRTFILCQHDFLYAELYVYTDSKFTFHTPFEGAQSIMDLIDASSDKLKHSKVSTLRSYVPKHQNFYRYDISIIKSPKKLSPTVCLI